MIDIDFTLNVTSESLVEFVLIYNFSSLSILLVDLFKLLNIVNNSALQKA